MKKNSPSASFRILMIAGVLGVAGSGCTDSTFRGESLPQASENLNQTGNDNPNPCPFGFDPEGGCLPAPDDGGDTGGDTGGETGGETPPAPTTANLSGAKAVAAGREHTCVLTKTNTVKCFGSNTYGQLGNPSAQNPSSVAMDVPGLSNVTSLVAGADHTCALTGGAVKCCGRNTPGQLGNDTTDTSFTPVEVVGLPAAISRIASGDEHSCATESGTTRKTFCWGSNEFGQLGINFSTASQPKANTSRPFRTTAGTIYYGDSISAGGKHTCLLASSKLYCAGDNSYGQLGADAGTKSYPAVRVGGGLGDYGKYVSAVSVGYEHSCAMVEGDELYCWGRNDLSQLAGATSATSTETPTRIFGAADGVVSVSAGGNRVCAALPAGLSCWGEVVGSSSPALNLGFTEYVFSPLQSPFLYAASTSATGENPQPVSGLGTPLVHFEVGQSHACAVIGESVRCWGRNDSLQLGNAAAGSYSESAVHAQRPL